MVGRIRPEDIEAVRERTDLSQVVQGYLQLRKAGRDSLVGLCPFHAEKTPSFSVSPAKQLYYCFGCGEGGNVFRFLEKVENLTFVEAVERLAAQAGVTLRYEGDAASARRAQGRRQVLHRAVAEAAQLYHRLLLEGREGADARAYLEGRGITRQSWERFGIGYAPGYPDFLLRRLSRSFSVDVLLEAGLVTRDAAGAVRDRFRGRVVFPIHDLGGNAVGFGGRLLEGQRAPAGAAKYVNSAESPIYHKGSVLYNLNRAKAEITRSGRAFLVEGYTDVVALDQAGVPSAVATCGTALGEEHVRLLSRFAELVVLAFDSDEAGARAAERAFAFHQRYPVELRVLVLPEGQDPADFVGAQGGEAFLELAQRAVPLVAYMLDRALRGRPLDGVEERARAVRAALPIVAALEEPVRREEYARLLAAKVGEPERSVMLQLERALEGRAERGAPERAGPRASPEEEVEREVLKLLLQAPELGAAWLPKLEPDRFAKPTHRKAFELLRAEAEPTGTPPAPSALVARAQQGGGEPLARLLAALSVEPLRSDGDPTPAFARRLFLRLEEFALKRQADRIRKELERVNPLRDPADHEAMFEALVRLERARRELRAEAEAVGTVAAGAGPGGASGRAGDRPPEERVRGRSVWDTGS
ncbi:MAG TPA: DNA primase [Actinomycetota bacterium]|nr:DNA primase [Actinomycetota bacterium]